MTDEKQRGKETYSIKYVITDSKICIRAECSRESEFIMPVIAAKSELVSFLSNNEMELHKKKINLRICTSGEFIKADTDSRIFNPVGGFWHFRSE